ncbi:MAG: tetratricopeptide repeat protein [Patescibacteria group bacterium]
MNKELTLEEMHQAAMLRDAGRTSEAIAMLSTYIDNTDPEIAVNALNSIGICYLNEERYDKAEDCYAQAYTIAVKNNMHDQLIGIARDRGINFKNWKKFSESESAFSNSIDLIKASTFESKEKDALLGITHSKLGLLYTDMERFNEAEKEFGYALAAADSSDHKYWQLITKLDYCSFLIKKGDFKLAIVLLDQGLIQEAKDQGKGYKLIEAQCMAGEAAVGLESPKKAREYYLQAQETLKTFNSEALTKRFGDAIVKKLSTLP